MNRSLTLHRSDVGVLLALQLALVAVAVGGYLAVAQLAYFVNGTILRARAGSHVEGVG